MSSSLPPDLPPDLPPALDASHLDTTDATQRPQPPVDVDQLFSMVNATTSRDRSAVLLIGCSAIALLVWCASANLPMPITLSGTVLAAMVLAKRRVLALVLFLLLALATPLAINGVDRMVYDYLFVSDLWQAVSLLALIVCLLRYLETDLRLFQRWRIAGQGDGRLLEDPGVPVGLHTNAQIRPFSWSLLRIPMALLLALALLNVWSLERFQPNRFRFDPFVYRAVVVTWTLALAAGIPLTVLSLLRWRKLTAAQAEIHLRKVYSEEADSEQRLLERARARYSAGD